MKQIAVILISIVSLLIMTAIIYSSEPVRHKLATSRYIPSLPMSFSHAEHIDQTCVDCHHNYTDNSGQGACLNCHLSKINLSYKLEEHFHGLCMGCHIAKQKNDGIEGGFGPIRRCSACHNNEALP